MNKRLLIALLASAIAWPAVAQTTDPIYDRPFVAGTGTTAIGGYLEGNTNYVVEDGISEGFSMELRRFNIFLYSAIGSRITFLSELEFEHGTEEIALETALIDFRISPQMALRAGILLPPLGTFNQNHDSPRWEFVDRPLVSTRIIPSTLSEVGFGLHGRVPVGGIDAGYQIYLVNGLGNGIVNNTEGRTDIPSGRDEEAFAEDNNGEPAVVGRIEARLPRWGTVGLAAYSGTYNTWRVEGDQVDDKRRVRLLTLDYAGSVGPVDLTGEAAMAWIDVPNGLSELFGDRQHGAFLDAVYPIHHGRVGAIQDATVSVAVRVEYADLNVGTFSGTGGRIGDEETAVALGLSFRPHAETVFKMNYRYHWKSDLLGNPIRLAGVQAGFATYF
ncbi:MAG: hypothetical protein HKN29_04935 [Rhodothermales bacterium]|nr:hypothetical protein [Rhodothermales bacterium]